MAGRCNCLLGIWRERPLHGYEIKQTIEEHMMGMAVIR
jgi:DNA-binding PadR family transcriptional regulator